MHRVKIVESTISTELARRRPFAIPMSVMNKALRKLRRVVDGGLQLDVCHQAVPQTFYDKSQYED
jgi:hypothetical protein